MCSSEAGIITRTTGPFERNWLIAWTRVALGSWAVRRKPVCSGPHWAGACGERK